jgi:anti-sigma regulatory factor (Ser/Thr protein kinase)
MVASETVSVPATLEGIRQAADAFAAFGASRALPSDLRWRFHVALDEVLSNNVGHGGRTGEIHLSFAVSDGVVGVAIRDDAPCFNPLLVPPPAPPDLDHPSDGGRGLALVRALMDDVRYEWRESRNHLHLSRRLES